MTDSTPNALQAGQEALETLRLMLADDGASDSARVAAAKALLERFLPKHDDETESREASERDAAIAELQGILAEFAAAKSVGAASPRKMAKKRKVKSTHAKG